MGSIEKILDPYEIPKFLKVKQTFDKEKIDIDDLPSIVEKEIYKNNLILNIKKGQKVGITAGSRGIANIALIINELVKHIKKMGAIPYIIPCMGSHGGATGEGQKKILNNLGITEDYIDAPIISSMETVKIGVTKSGVDVYIDKKSTEMDSLVVVNRIKPHTAFRSEIESGIQKMLVIGLGKQKGAQSCHFLGFGQMYNNITEIADVVINKTNIAFAFGIIENSYDETLKCIAMGKNEIQTKEPELLKLAKSKMPRILFDKIDVLVVDEMGKNFAGGGMDTNIINRFASKYITGDGPEVSKIAVLDLTPESKGNATGMGNADYSTQKFFEKVSFEDTIPNALTSTLAGPCKVPVILKNDIYAIKAGIMTCNTKYKKGPRIVRIKNTLKIDEIWISEALADEVNNNDNLEIISDALKLEFDNNGYIKK